MPAPDSLTVLTWNLWWRFGPWEKRLPAIVETIRRLDPDVAALQEVWVADGTSSAHVIGEALGYEVAVAHRLELDGVGFGNAVLSRWPIEETDTAPLPAGDENDEERSVVLAVVDAPRDPVQVYSTHLSWRHDHSSVRQLQVAELCRMVADHRPRAFPPVVCGDLNAEPHSDEVRMLTGQAAVPVPGLVFRDAWTAPGCEGPGSTWSNANPYAEVEYEQDRRIDYVLTGWRRNDGRGAPLSCRVVGDEPIDGTWPSDHFGVLAELRTSAEREPLEEGPVPVEVADVEVQHLGGVVPPPERDRTRTGGQLPEGGRLRLVHGAALADEAGGRARGQRGRVPLVDGAQVSLGPHVQGDGSRDRRAEQRCQPGGAARLVALVDLAAEPSVGQLEEVADVVQQARGHRCVGGAGGPGQGGRLQRVLELGDLFVVALGTPALVEREQLVDRGGGHRTGRPWKSPINDTATRDPSPAPASSAAFCA